MSLAPEGRRGATHQRSVLSPPPPPAYLEIFPDRDRFQQPQQQTPERQPEEQHRDVVRALTPTSDQSGSPSSPIKGPPPLPPTEGQSSADPGHPSQLPPFLSRQQSLPGTAIQADEEEPAEEGAARLVHMVLFHVMIRTSRIRHKNVLVLHLFLAREEIAVLGGYPWSDGFAAVRVLGVVRVERPRQETALRHVLLRRRRRRDRSRNRGPIRQSEPSQPQGHRKTQISQLRFAFF